MNLRRLEYEVPFLESCFRCYWLRWQYGVGLCSYLVEPYGGIGSHSWKTWSNYSYIGLCWPQCGGWSWTVGAGSNLLDLANSTNASHPLRGLRRQSHYQL